MHRKKIQKTSEEIAMLVARSDREAFALLYDQYWHPVYKTACRYLKSSELAEDLVQDIFMKLWLKREHLLTVASLDDFVFIVARNAIVSALRKKQKTHTITFQKEPLFIGMPENADNGLILKETETLINKAVDQLPSQQRKIFLLTRKAGLSHAAIADMLNINVRTVNNHISRALHSIQQFLKEQDKGKSFIIFFLLTVHIS
ncbi:MAG: RNA polymerase sigma-70 factor [Chitinophagaceae bacterium]|nr:RNA polymerase sigma-70 factor [Chitinophagaceae bacterium]